MGEWAGSVMGATALSPKNVAAIKTLFAIVFAVGSLLGTGWSLVLEPFEMLETLFMAHLTTGRRSSVNAEAHRRSTGERGAAEGAAVTDELSGLFHQMQAIFRVAEGLPDAPLLLLLQTLCASTASALAALDHSHSQRAVRVFGVGKAAELTQANMHRVALVWPSVVAHLMLVTKHARKQARARGCERVVRTSSVRGAPVFWSGGNGGGGEAGGGGGAGVMITKNS